jgi:hypothetical protein
LAIDINIVERYQDVYPTKQQTGIELFDLVHTSSRAVGRVALYFENSILPADRELLAASGAVATRVERLNGKLVVESPHGLGVRWSGPAMVNGRLWPVAEGETVWIPGGPQVIEPAGTAPARFVTRFSGQLHSARAIRGGVELAYDSQSRTFAVLDWEPSGVEIDGHPAELVLRGTRTVALPKGQHVVSVR